MRRSMVLMIHLLVGATVVAACAKESPPAAAPGTPAASAPAGGPRTPDQEWNKLVEDGRKEGKVTVYASWRPEVREALSPAFRNKYGINLEFLPFGRGAELIARMQAEKTAGLVIADLVGTGGTTMVTGLKPAGLMGPMEPLLLVPEVKDPRNWLGGQFPWKDKDRTGISMAAAVQRMVIRNTDLVKEELKDYRDVLRPQFKGKIILNDPTVEGIGNTLFTHLALDLWTPEETYEFYRQLLRLDPVIERDNRVNVESVARGKYAIALGTQADIVANFTNLGSPIAPIIVKEGARVSGSSYSIGAPPNRGSPKASVVFINWLLSKEGQTVVSKASGLPSTRADVPTDGIDPLYLPMRGEKLFPDTEEWQLTAGTTMLDMARKIVAEARR
ncbi:MAG: extracellular solute-binding protein [Chloroflexi bacterium]|nr:extracellular solute-binding protein [Chloroflexota bacterium]